MTILTAVLAMGGLGLLLGLALALASKYLSVGQDANIPLVTEALPGANCGACGYAGCAALAGAIVEGSAVTGACPVGGTSTAERVAEIMGVPAQPVAENVAVVMCRGTLDASKKKYIYEGLSDCEVVAGLSGGDKVCRFGCLGLGNCVRVCRFGALTVTDGVAAVDPDKCTACGICLAACPKSLIRMVPKANVYSVRCASHDKGADMKDICLVGCIACRICEKACEYGAIAVSSNIAVIDYAKCTNCGACAEKCPKKIIYCKTQGKGV